MDTTNTPTTDTNAAEVSSLDVFATYCPEDNKLRLYIGRVPRDEYLKLRAQGWKALHKQREAGGGDFVATWTPERRDTALELGGVILDEDMGPAERAADRAERFGGYLVKRMDDATGHADRYDAGPSAHGFQSTARAEKAAARHDKIAGRAVDAWDKAEYWQRRTAGVISHALHVSSPSVRMGRIKELESEIRKYEKSRDERSRVRGGWAKIAAETDAALQTAAAIRWAGATSHLTYWHEYQHPRQPERRPTSLHDLLTTATDPITGAEAAALYLESHPEQTAEGPWLTHYRHRLAYETAMLEAQGGRAGALEIEPGGFICYRRRSNSAPQWVRIQRVNKSPASGRVTSVMVKAAGDRWGNTSEGFHLAQIDVERMAPEDYRAPTDAERAEWVAQVKKEKAEAKAKKPPAPPLINPTDEDAARLQAIWNERNRADYIRHHGDYDSTRKTWDEKAPKVERVTQAVYSASSKGSYAKAETRDVYALGVMGDHTTDTGAVFRLKFGGVLFQIRTASGSMGRRVIILSDKPQKPLPAAVWQAFPDAPKAADVRHTLPEVAQALAKLNGYGTPSESELETLHRAAAAGFVFVSRFGNKASWTDAGLAELRAVEAERKAAPKVEAQTALALA